MHIAIVIPALNEAETIGKIIADVKSMGTVVVVNDGSTDATEQKAREAGAVVVNHLLNKGYDAAIKSGLTKAFEGGADIVVTIDADGQHSTSDIIKLTQPIQSGFADIAVGVRPNAPRVSETMFRSYGKFRHKIEDPCCGLKAYSKKAYEDHSYKLNKPSIGTALAFAAAKSGKRIINVPITIQDRADHSRFGQSLKADLKILKAISYDLVG